MRERERERVSQLARQLATTAVFIIVSFTIRKCSNIDKVTRTASAAAEV